MSGSAPALPTIAVRLQDAQVALHRLYTGQLTASIRDRNGETVTYSKADLGALESYVDRLKYLNANGLTDMGAPVARTPIRFLFG